METAQHLSQPPQSSFESRYITTGRTNELSLPREHNLDDIPTRDKEPDSKQPIRKLNLTTNPTAKSRIDQMIEQNLLSDTRLDGQPLRQNNDNFWQELKQISMNSQQSGKKQTAQKTGKTGSGQPVINFELHDALLEDKVKSIAKTEIMKSQANMQNQLNQKTKRLREFVETQMRQSQLSVENLERSVGTLKDENNKFLQASMSMSQSGFAGLMGSKNLESSYNLRAQPLKEDFKTTALKRGLLDDAKGALVAERLQCKPIQGHDLPLSQLGLRQSAASAAKVGMGGALLVEVENMDKIQMPQMPGPGPPLPDSELILRSLLPTSLQAPSMAFIEESDLISEDDLIQDSKKSSNPDQPQKLQGPLTAFQQERKQLKIIEEKEAKQEPISDEERERTIRCLMKCMEYQIDGVNQQAKEIQAAIHKQDLDMKQYAEEIKQNQQKLKVQELNRALEKTKQIAGAYKYSTKVVKETEDGEIQQLSDGDDDEVEIEQRVDIAELITDNQVLLNRVDKLLQMEDEEVSESYSEDQLSQVESLTSSLIDGLFKQMSAKDKPKKKKATNHFENKGKQYYNHETALKRKPVLPTAAAQGKSRLFDYEAKHKREIEAKKRVKANKSPEKPQRDTQKGHQAQVMDQAVKEAVEDKKRQIYDRVASKHPQIGQRKKSPKEQRANEELRKIDNTLDQEINRALGSVEFSLKTIYK